MFNNKRALKLKPWKNNNQNQKKNLIVRSFIKTMVVKVALWLLILKIKLLKPFLML